MPRFIISYLVGRSLWLKSEAIFEVMECSISCAKVSHIIPGKFDNSLLSKNT